MVPIFNLRGYTAADPLDRARPAASYLLTIGTSLLVALIFLYVQAYTLHIVSYENVWVFWVGCALYTFVVGTILFLLRKSSSLLFYLLIVCCCASADLWLQAHYRDLGLEAWWKYEPGTLLYAIPVPLRFLVAWSFDGIIQGALVLWFARVVAAVVFRESKSAPAPTEDQQNSLFPSEWTAESVEKPHRDAGFWMLRLLGLGYFAYLLFCLIGILGASPWPQQARMLIVMTYQNPALAINTFAKIGLMVLLAFIGAYNRNVRFYSTLGLFTGHLASTTASIGFYFYDPPGNYSGTVMPTYRDFLLTSAAVDGVMVLIFIWIMARYRSEARIFAAGQEFSDSTSLPDQLTRLLFYAISASLALMIPGFLLLRIEGDGTSGLSAVFGYPDPQLGNTITLLATMSLVSLLLGLRKRLREYQVPVLLLGFVVTMVCKAAYVPLASILGRNRIITRTGAITTADWYFIAAAAADAVAVGLIIGLRKLTYNIDNTIN